MAKTNRSGASALSVIIGVITGRKEYKSSYGSAHSHLTRAINNYCNRDAGVCILAVSIHNYKGEVMDLNQAIEKHSEWKIKFRQAISDKETMDAETIAKDNCCELGKWLHSEAKSKFDKFPSYSDCVTKHAAFHAEAGKVATTINAKKYTEAEAMIGPATPYTAASSAVRHAIMHLKQEAGI